MGLRQSGAAPVGGRAEVLIDRAHLAPGKEIKGQGNALQERAKHALDGDPDFTRKVVAVKMEGCDLPDEFKSVLYRLWI